MGLGARSKAKCMGRWAWSMGQGAGSMEQDERIFKYFNFISNISI
jgi:hypothetical protein